MSRWTILAVLFTVRTCMGFQFQAVPSLSPVLIRDLAMTVADIGILIGLYHSPGIAMALPGGAIGARLGDKRTVGLGLLLMLLGALIVILVPGVQAQFFGRLVAGVGGVLLNVLMTKMVADWFADKEIATAMGIFANSWPVGIALSLVVTPWLVVLGGLWAALAAVALMIALSGLLFWALYAPPGGEVRGSGASQIQLWPDGPTTFAVVAAGLVWGLYNAGLGVVFGFGTLILTERGWTLAAASSTTSIVLWLVAISVPLGGFIGDRTGRHFEVLVASLIAFALGLVIAVRTDAIVPTYVVLGLVAGLPAGLIMSLPMQALPQSARAIGMGIYFTLFYAAQFAGPWLAGRVAALAGTAAATFDLGAAMVLTAMLLVLAFRWLRRRQAAAAAIRP